MSERYSILANFIFWGSTKVHRGVAIGSGVEEGARGSESPSCDLMGAQPPNSVNFCGA